MLLCAIAFISLVLGARAWDSPSLASSIYSLGNASYYIAPVPVSQLLLANSTEAAPLEKSTELVPFTVIVFNGSSFSDEDLSLAIASYQAADDVWNPNFLTGELCSATKSSNLAPNFRRYLSQLELGTFRFV